MGLYFTALFQPGMRSLKRLSLKSSKGWCGRTVWWRTVPQTQKKAKMTTCINTIGKGATFSLFHWLNPKCLGSVQSNKVFLYGQTNESKIFLWQNCFWGTFLVSRGFFCWVLVFFSPSCPMEDFSSVKRNTQDTACVSWVSHLGIYHWLGL